MPELPEVETIRRGLEPKLIQRRIQSTLLTLPRLLVYPNPKIFIKELKDTTIESISRHGKYLLIHLDNKLDLMIHLGMTGRLFIHPPKQELDKHTHFRLKLVLGSTLSELRFVDARTFGKLALVKRGDYTPVTGLNHLGPDPLSKEFTIGNLKKIMSCKRQMKAILMDQSRIAGLGNIYVDEVLFESKINPKKPASKLKPAQIELLYKVILRILKNALHYRGTTILSYVDTEVKYGEYQNHLKVYGRENEPCIICKTPIRRIILVSRSTYYCPTCQE